jgi:hypothetical protein
MYSPQNSQSSIYFPTDSFFLFFLSRVPNSGNNILSGGTRASEYKYSGRERLFKSCFAQVEQSVAKQISPSSPYLNFEPSGNFEKPQGT